MIKKLDFTLDIKNASMKNLFLLCFILLSFSACEDELMPDPEPGDISGTVNLNMKATYGDIPLTMFDSLAYGDATIQIAQSEFLLSNVTLVSDQGSEHLVDDIFYVNFTSNNAPNKPDQVIEGTNLNLGQIPYGKYTQIKFSIGVDEDLNAMVPADFPSSNPLSTTSHWSTWDSFIFYKLQGTYYGQGAGQENLAFIFHIGQDQLFRTIELPIDVLVEDDSSTIGLTLEHQKLLNDQGTLFDIPSSPDNHTPILAGPMFMFADNYQAAFSN